MPANAAPELQNNTNIVTNEPQESADHSEHSNVAGPSNESERASSEEISDEEEEESFTDKSNSESEKSPQPSPKNQSLVAQKHNAQHTEDQSADIYSAVATTMMIGIKRGRENTKDCNKNNKKQRT